MPAVSNWLLSSTIQWLAACAVAAPFVILAVLSCRGRGNFFRGLGLLALFFWVSLVLARSDQAVRVLPSPWQGMVFEAVFALVVIFAAAPVFRGLLSLRITPSAWRASLLATVLLLVFVLARGFSLRLLNLSAAPGPLNMEFLIYQATLPGIAEELAYRGVLQTSMNRMFARRWRLFGAQLGWGWVVTTIIFWAIHAFRVPEQGGLEFYWPTLTLQLWAGAVFGWIRERSGSLLPAILAHNVTNVVWSLL